MKFITIHKQNSNSGLATQFLSAAGGLTRDHHGENTVQACATGESAMLLTWLFGKGTGEECSNARDILRYKYDVGTAVLKMPFGIETGEEAENLATGESGSLGSKSTRLKWVEGLPVFILDESQVTNLGIPFSGSEHAFDKNEIYSERQNPDDMVVVFYRLSSDVT